MTRMLEGRTVLVKGSVQGIGIRLFLLPVLADSVEKVFFV
jgi:hypothetical protein